MPSQNVLIQPTKNDIDAVKQGAENFSDESARYGAVAAIWYSMPSGFDVSPYLPILIERCDQNEEPSIKVRSFAVKTALEIIEHEYDNDIAKPPRPELLDALNDVLEKEQEWHVLSAFFVKFPNLPDLNKYIASFRPGLEAVADADPKHINISDEAGKLLKQYGESSSQVGASSSTKKSVNFHDVHLKSQTKTPKQLMDAFEEALMISDKGGVALILPALSEDGSPIRIAFGNATRLERNYINHMTCLKRNVALVLEENGQTSDGIPCFNAKGVEFDENVKKYDYDF